MRGNFGSMQASHHIMSAETTEGGKRNDSCLLLIVRKKRELVAGTDHQFSALRVKTSTITLRVKTSTITHRVKTSTMRAGLNQKKTLALRAPRVNPPLARGLKSYPFTKILAFSQKKSTLKKSPPLSSAPKKQSKQ